MRLLPTLLAAAGAGALLQAPLATAATAPARPDRTASSDLGAANHPLYGGPRPPLHLPAEDLSHAPLNLGVRAMPGPISDRPDESVLARGVAALAAAAATLTGRPSQSVALQPGVNETVAGARLVADLLRAATVEGRAAGALPPQDYVAETSAVGQACPTPREDGEKKKKRIRGRACPSARGWPTPLSTSASASASLLSDARACHLSLHIHRLPLPHRPPPRPRLLPRPALRTVHRRP